MSGEFEEVDRQTAITFFTSKAECHTNRVVSIYSDGLILHNFIQISWDILTALLRIYEESKED